MAIFGRAFLQNFGVISRNLTAGNSLNRQLPIKSEVDSKVSKTYVCDVYMNNISWDTQKEDIESLFEGMNKPTQIRVLKKKDGKHKGAAFLSFRTFRDATSALALNKKIFMGREIALNLANDKFAIEKAKSMQEKRLKCTIFVNNLPFKGRDENALHEIFSVCGRIECISFPKNENGLFLPYGFVKFANPKSADLALKMKNISLLGRELIIKSAN